MVQIINRRRCQIDHDMYRSLSHLWARCEKYDACMYAGVRLFTYSQLRVYVLCVCVCACDAQAFNTRIHVHIFVRVCVCSCGVRLVCVSG